MQLVTNESSSCFYSIYWIQVYVGILILISGLIYVLGFEFTFNLCSKQTLVHSSLAYFLLNLKNYIPTGYAYWSPFFSTIIFHLPNYFVQLQIKEKENMFLFVIMKCSGIIYNQIVYAVVNF